MSLYPPIEPYEHGFLAVGGEHQVYWEVCGNPHGKPAVVLHGGPGSGCSEWWRRLFNPELYRIVLFDQRNCGRSLPHASDPFVDLESNTTWDLVRDIERLRHHLLIEKWLVLGGSWGSTLALAYAELHPDRVSEMILFGVGLGRMSELDWLFRGGLAKFFPAEWDALRTALHLGLDETITDGLYRRLSDPDPKIRHGAANAWCLWESATPAWPPTAGLAARFADPNYALAFARIVNHYVRHDLWLDEGLLLTGADGLRSIPGVLINGRFDFQSPLTNAWELHQHWPQAELRIVEDAGHAASHPGLTAELVRATDQFANPR